MTTSYHVQWTDIAKSDLKTIVEDIAEESPQSALQVLVKIQSQGNKLKLNPERGRYVPELKDFNVFVYRELILKPWRLIYRFDASNVYILACLDSRRDLENLLIERLVR